MTIKRELATQLSKEHDLELKLEEAHNKLCSVVVTKDNIDVQLQEEKLRVISMQQEIKETEVCTIILISIYYTYK